MPIRVSFNGAVLRASEGEFFGQLTQARVDPNQYLVLYSVVNGQARFSSMESLDLANKGRGFCALNFAGIKTEMVSEVIVIPGNPNSVVPTDVSLSRAASNENTVALYRVDDLSGGLDVTGDRIIDYSPGDSGYAQAALTRAADPSYGQLLTAPDNFSTSHQRVNLVGAGMYGVVIIPNANIDDVLRKNPDNQLRSDNVAFFSFTPANPDGLSHSSRRGLLTYGFEDQPFGGDFDFQDINLQLRPIV